MMFNLGQIVYDLERDRIMVHAGVHLVVNEGSHDPETRFNATSILINEDGGVELFYDTDPPVVEIMGMACPIMGTLVTEHKLLGITVNQLLDTRDPKVISSAIKAIKDISRLKRILKVDKENKSVKA